MLEIARYIDKNEKFRQEVVSKYNVIIDANTLESMLEKYGNTFFIYYSGRVLSDFCFKNDIVYFTETNSWTGEVEERVKFRHNILYSIGELYLKEGGSNE